MSDKGKYRTRNRKRYIAKMQLLKEREKRAPKLIHCEYQGVKYQTIVVPDPETLKYTAPPPSIFTMHQAAVLKAASNGHCHSCGRYQ